MRKNKYSLMNYGVDDVFGAANDIAVVFGGDDDVVVMNDVFPFIFFNFLNNNKVNNYKM
jgi:hypothetical protein